MNSGISLSDFIQKTHQYVTVDFIDGLYVVENKQDSAGLVGYKGIGNTLELAIDNFLYSWRLTNDFSTKSNKIDDNYLYEQYRCY